MKSKLFRRISAFLLAAVLCVGAGAVVPATQMAYAAGDTEEIVEEDKAMGDSYEDSMGEIKLFSTPSAPSGTVATGVDISYHNGTIDFAKLAKSVDFVIIRCGYGSDNTSQDDKNFATYVKGCVKYNIPFGVYLYSYANTTAKAANEAQHTIRLLETLDDYGAELSLPVFYDMEDSTTASVSNSTKASIAKTYCSAVEAAGYETGIYSSKSWWTNYLTDSYFNGVTKWVAQYNSKCTYTGSYSMWQCTSSASVSGISGSVDLNYMLEDIYTTYETVYNGVDYSAVYDYNYYINKYSDLKKAFGSNSGAALQHFVTYGMKEGRQAKSTFDVTSYRNKYRDLRRAFGSDLPSYYRHYINYGKKEGRVATGVSTLQNAVTTYNGVDYSAVYDYNYYISKYSDLKRAFNGDDDALLKHFVTYGMKEGRQAKSTFNVTTYKNRYADLRRAFGSDLKQYYLHYIHYGQKEGRTAV